MGGGGGGEGGRGAHLKEIGTLCTPPLPESLKELVTVVVMNNAANGGR